MNHSEADPYHYTSRLPWVTQEMREKEFNTSLIRGTYFYVKAEDYS